MALDLVTRDFDRKHEKHKHVPGVYSPGDGIRQTVHLNKPAREEVAP